MQRWRDRSWLHHAEKGRSDRMYLRYMVIAFLTNGLGAFGLRILAGMGHAPKYNLEYLCFWYLAGAVIALSVYMRQHHKPFRREILIAAGMAACSMLGQLGMALALSRGLPGHIVFPVAIGGGMLFVTAVGVLAFREKLSLYGYIGVPLGFVSLVLVAIA